MGANTEDAEEQFRAFVTARWQAMLRTAYLLCGDHGRAEDLLQTALVRTHRRWSRIDDPELYTRRVLINLNISWWRRPRLTEHLTDALPETAGDDHPAAYDVRDALWSAVLTLPSRMRAVLVLRYFEDLSEAEVARVLGCSLGTVKSQASRGLDRLRNHPAIAETTAGSAHPEPSPPPRGTPPRQAPPPRPAAGVSRGQDFSPRPAPDTIPRPAGPGAASRPTSNPVPRPSEKRTP